MSDQKTPAEVQLETLSGKLNSAAVSTRDNNGFSLSYLEGWYVIAVLNDIFGFDGWNGEIVQLTQTTDSEKFTTKNGKQMFRVGARCLYKLTIRFKSDKEVSREDVGHGTGIGPTESEAYESAEKEAATDALKRAARTLGNKLGLGLYDKKQRGVEK